MMDKALDIVEGVMPKSHEIGRQLEEAVDQVLQSWGVRARQQQFVTTQGINLRVDFWLPEQGAHPSIVIECKNFDVASKQSSRPRKVQEALYELILVRRHISETKESRIILVTGHGQYLEKDISLLTAELGPDFHVIQFQQMEKHKGLFA
jgi:hypothetical protein